MKTLAAILFLCMAVRASGDPTNNPVTNLPPVVVTNVVEAAVALPSSIDLRSLSDRQFAEVLFNAMLKLGEDKWKKGNKITDPDVKQAVKDAQKKTK